MRSAFRAPAAAAASAAALLLASPGLPASAGTAPATPLPCHARMSNSHPKDYTRTDVLVTTVSKAKVTTVAHYKTVNRKHHGMANAKGKADIPYYISGATPGFKVKVSVHVAAGGRTGNCATSFTPHR